MKDNCKPSPPFTFHPSSLHVHLPALLPAGMCEERPVQASRIERSLGAQNLIIETGKLAKQAHGAVTVRYGDTLTLVTAVAAEADEGRAFFPLFLDSLPI